MTYRVGSRPIKVGKQVLAPGAEIPDISIFPRLESWLASRRVIAE